MYVWFDALVNYISTLGWPKNKENFEKFWRDGETVQTAGKDMVKFQSVMWQGMLMSAGLPTTNTIVYHGFITGEGGIKISKSIGNVISPNEIVQEYGTDSLRYFLLREISPFEDSPFTMERFKEAYNSGLANGLGNLTSRIMTMAEKHLLLPVVLDAKFVSKTYNKAFKQFEIKHAIDVVWELVTNADKTIQTDEPFKLISTNHEKAVIIINGLVRQLGIITELLEPFMPDTAFKIQKCIRENKRPETPLFPRKD
jgi:methionyl-tRNA synthetase